MSSQIAKLIARIAENLPEMDPDTMQNWIERPKDLQRFLAGLAPPNKGNKLTWEQALQKAYDLLGLKKEYEVFRKEHPYSDKEGHWVIDMLKGLTCKKVIDALRKQGVRVKASDTLDQDVTENQRDPSKGSYAVAFKATVEADEENKNQSANDRKKQECQDITLLERLFLELVYFLINGEHLDIKSYTLCSGSRYRDGYVPFVNFYADSRAVYVDWYHPDNRHGNIRTRSVVPVNLKD